MTISAYSISAVAHNGAAAEHRQDRRALHQATVQLLTGLRNPAGPGAADSHGMPADR